MRNHGRGFSLIELMMVVGALGGLAMIVMQLTGQQNRSTAHYAFSNDANIMTNEIVAILSDPVRCNATFLGRNAVSTPAGTVTAINNTQFYVKTHASAPSQGYSNANIKINSYQLVSTNSEVDTNKKSTLEIEFEKSTILKSATSTTVKKKINLTVAVDGSRNILDCRALSSGSTDIWERGSGTNIYYSAGNVGIGTTSPSGLLEVSKNQNDLTTHFINNLTVGSASGSRLYMRTATGGGSLIMYDNGYTFGGRSHFASRFGVFADSVANGLDLLATNPTGDIRFYSGGDTTAAQRMVINNTGNVGIGTSNPLYKLHVSGTSGMIASSSSLAATGNALQMFVESPDTGVLNYGHSSGPAGGRLDLRLENSPRVTILQSNGNVGVGTTSPNSKLDVSGEVKIASSGAACSTTNEGSMRYNSTSKIMEFCNGTSWGPVGGSGGGFGGSFMLDTFGGTCYQANPLTGACSCPAGTVGYLSGQAYMWSPWDKTMIICY